MNLPFKNKVALVTGAASGIGAGDSQSLRGDGSCRLLAMQPCRKFCDQPRPRCRWLLHGTIKHEN
jgi:hypothetical protein